MKAIGVVLTFWLLSLLLSGCDNQPEKSAQKANAQSTLAPVPT